MIVISQQPKFGENYKAGYIGASYRNDKIQSYGIAWFSRDKDPSLLPVSHVFMVKDEHTVIEAHAGKGVAEAPIEPYFDDPGIIVSFRKPVGLTPEIAAQLIANASERLGSEYDMSLIIAHGAASSFLGRMIGKVTGGKSDAFLAKLGDSKDEWMCSELVADSMNRHPLYKDKGILSKASAAIKPRELISDTTIFAEWK